MAVYCSASDVESILSSEGVNLHVDDRWPIYSDDPGAPISPAAGQTTEALQHMEYAIDRASARVEIAIGSRFDISTASTNRWVKWCTAYLAACEVCRRRGNSIPDSLLAQCEEYSSLLVMIGKGEIGYIPGLEPRVEPIPSMSNLRVDNRFFDARVRVQEVISAGRPTSSKPRYVDRYSSTQAWMPVY